MQSLLLLALIALANVLCLLGLFWLRIRVRKSRQRYDAFVTCWRPVMMKWSLGNPVPLPVTAMGKEQQIWLLQLWNDLQQSLRGDSAVYLNRLLQELGLERDLLRRLSSHHPDEKVAAIQALGHLQNRQAWDPLVQLALHGDSLYAFHALRSLLLISAEAAVPVLLAVLRAHREWSRARLLGTLRRIPSPRLVKPLGQALLAALHAGDFELGRDLALLLGTLRYPGILPYLREVLLREPTPQLLDIAAEILGDMRDITALPALQKLVVYPDVMVRKRALQAIGKMADAAQIPVLLRGLEDPDWWVVYTALTALYDIPGIRAEKLAELAQHPLPQVRDALHYYQETVSLNALAD